jgi:pimeloyl-ACP methyl ester carboxylesterase
MRHFVPLRRGGAAARIRADDFAYVDELWRRWSPAWRDLPASETVQVKHAFLQPGCLEAACAYYRALPLRLPASLRAPVRVPTVTFAGEHDLVPARAFEKARRCFEASYEVVQMPGGHFLHREHADAFAAELVRVLGDQQAPLKQIS